MANKKATSEPIEPTPEYSVGEMTLEQLQEEVLKLKAEKAARESEISRLKEDNEGWLIKAKNPMYNGKTLNILFTDGLAFIPRNKELPDFEYKMPSEREMSKIAKDNSLTLAEVKAQFEETAKVTPVERAVRTLVNDFGYEASYFSKDEMDKLASEKARRAIERADAQEKLSKSEMTNKLILDHRM